MKWSPCVIVVGIIIVLWLHGGIVESTESGCKKADVFLSYLDINRYNTSNPYIEFNDVVNQMLDVIIHGKQYSDDIYDFAMCWIDVCDAEDDEQEAAAWKVLAKEIHHRLHTDQSVFYIVKTIFGDRLVPWIMNPPNALSFADSNATACVHKLTNIFLEHCGTWHDFGLKYFGNFYAMCILGVGYDEFTKATRETCGDYVYTPSPLLI